MSNTSFFFESLYQITPLIVFGIETHFVELLDVSNVMLDNYVSMPITPWTVYLLNSKCPFRWMNEQISLHFNNWFITFPSTRLNKSNANTQFPYWYWKCYMLKDFYPRCTQTDKQNKQSYRFHFEYRKIYSNLSPSFVVCNLWFSVNH